MEFFIKKLNYVISELDRLYSINSGGCCYLCYTIAKWLENYKIDYNFVIQDNQFIEENKGKHYCIQLLHDNLFINKDPKYKYSKTLKVNSLYILNYYKSSNWSEKYDSTNNAIINKCIEEIFKM